MRKLAKVGGGNRGEVGGEMRKTGRGENTKGEVEVRGTQKCGRSRKNTKSLERRERALSEDRAREEKERCVVRVARTRVKETRR